MDKAAKRIMAKQQKANLKAGTPNADSDIAEPGLVGKIVKITASGPCIILIRLYNYCNAPTSRDEIFFQGLRS